MNNKFFECKSCYQRFEINDLGEDVRDCPECGGFLLIRVEVECCGEKLQCSGFTNTCPTCGADYNNSGQRLAPREQWGEETGETVEDILSVDDPGLDPFEDSFREEK